MSDKSKEIFGNEISKRSYEKALKSKEKFVKKYGDDSDADYSVAINKNERIGDLLGVYDVRIGDAAQSRNAKTIPLDEMTGGSNSHSAGFDAEKGIIVGNIRMGFGHYRISMAMASCANALGYVPYWMDLNSYPDTTCTKVISEQNDLYSLGSRISQKSRLFNKVVWEPMNYEGFKKLTYNSSDQKNAELMAPVFKNIPKDIPLIGTHVWPAQAAIHAGMKYVVNAIPDNWPMALHLAEGSLHTVQTHSSYIGYRTLCGMQGNKVLRAMPKDSILYTGHYIDHELVSNIERDCEARAKRAENGEPMRFLLTIGGAGAQMETFAAIIKYLMPFIDNGRAALYINIGDHRRVWDQLMKKVKGLKNIATTHFDDWDETVRFCNEAVSFGTETGASGNMSGVGHGIHIFYHSNIFEAVYSTNLLMRAADVLVTKPSELAFYPVPKLFIKRIGGHEMWGAIHSAEIGDGTTECRDIPHTVQMLELFLQDKEFFKNMCDNIIQNEREGIYNGAYEVVKAAFSLR